MKPRYKIGDKVKLHKAILLVDKEYLGKIFTIKYDYKGMGTDNSNWYSVQEVNIGFREDQLKKFSPSRTGTRDPKTGRFVSKKKGITFYKSYEKARNIIFPETYLDDLVYRPIKGNIANKLDSKQRNYQKIERIKIPELSRFNEFAIDILADKINEIIDELGRRV